MLQFRSLQQRFVVFMLLPVALLLAVMGAMGFVYARNAMLRQWEEVAHLRLQRAAHHVDMRLARPKEWVDFYLRYYQDQPHSALMQRQILKEMEGTDGVVAIRVKSIGTAAEAMQPMMGGPKPVQGGGNRMAGNAMARGMPSNRHFTVTRPRYNPDTAQRTVSITTQALDDTDKVGLEVEVVMDFDYLLQDLPYSGWWQSRKTFLVDEDGTVLASQGSIKEAQLGETGDPLERKVSAALQGQQSLTLRGEGHPPEEVGGFYRLAEASWYLVVFSGGDEILAPIIGFRNYYLGTLAGFIFAILLLIRRVSNRMAREVEALSGAAGDIARGAFGPPLPLTRQDEIGKLTASFNAMTAQLRDRARLRQDLNLAKEVQQSLLPDAIPRVAGLDVAGRSIYCEETGGDYFDYLKAGANLHVVVGDVSGHGIAAALLMSAVRAGLRQRHNATDGIGRLVADVNRQAAMDVGASGRFVTLFYMVVDPVQLKLSWVRAGHDPGLLYRRAADRFENLLGRGLPLGVEADATYGIETLAGLAAGDIILVGTDGIWEATDAQGRMFGKAALKELVRRQRDASAQTIVDAVFQAVARYLGQAKPSDDMTLVVVKVGAGLPHPS
jgi:sigma-B regulation protein RsbU (phosphoserine phosphatase)